LCKVISPALAKPVTDKTNPAKAIFKIYYSFDILCTFTNNLEGNTKSDKPSTTRLGTDCARKISCVVSVTYKNSINLNFWICKIVRHRVTQLSFSRSFVFSTPAGKSFTFCGLTERNISSFFISWSVLSIERILVAKSLLISIAKVWLIRNELLRQPF
jgi:hypothetical protein